MSINKRQFNLLQAMGITVWQRRELSKQNSISSTVTATQQNSAEVSETSYSDKSSKSAQQSNVSQNQELSNKVVIDLDALLKQPLFKDIISCLGASSADLSIVNDQIDIGIINWQFSKNTDIEFKHNCLITPELTILANSPALKKSLWQSLGHLSST